MRCFVGLQLPPPVLDALDDVAGPLERLGADVRWVARDDRHVTLKFLGEVDRRQCDAIAAALRGEDWPVAQLRLWRLGQFPARGAPRVVWAGLDGDVAALRATAERLERAAERAGVPREERPFHAHVTLGRVRSPLGVSRLQAALRAGDLAPEPVAFASAGPVLFARREDGGRRGDGGSYEVLAAARGGT